ncbi:Os02g0197125 [Oryza sativa Japonica Group]|uniref:Os02g0197125 protein n=1 Tax=Oryza sativa subsp. japonica TaxID=39947 RepID=A0A0P0VFZ8_ORYSJ|nr:hypothetical protein EE612_009514 [Oryza sativa]BAS77467.1 Os02g0197125 [Oryza sativa Japonica Group]
MMHESNPYTRTQKKKPISKEFWNRMKWIKWRTILGLLNQKCSLHGFVQGFPVASSGQSAASCASLVLMSSSFVPTMSRSCRWHLFLGLWELPFIFSSRKTITKSHRY